MTSSLSQKIRTVPGGTALTLAALALLLVFVPVTAGDIAIIITMLVLAGALLLQEYLLLVIIAARPTLDYWRDVVITQSPVAINLNALLSILTFLWCVAALWQHRKNLREIPLKNIFIGSALWMAVSAFWSLSPLITVVEVLKYCNLGLLFAVSFVVIKNKKITISKLVLSISLSAIIPIMYALVQLSTGKGIDTFDVVDRVFGTFAHPNVLAFFLMFLLFIHHHFSTMAPTEFWSRHPWLKISVGIGLLSLLLLTYTRAAWIGLLIYALLVSILRYRKPSWRIILLCMISYMLLFPVTDWLTKHTSYRPYRHPLIARLTSRSEEADSVSWRVSLLQSNINSFIHGNHQINGVGYGTFATYWERTREPQYANDDSAESHNDFLRLLIETGVIGLASYVLLLGAWTMHCGRLVADPPTAFRARTSRHILLKRLRERDVHIFLFASGIVFAAVSFSDNMLHHTPVVWMLYTLWGGLMAEEQIQTTGPNFIHIDQ